MNLQSTLALFAFPLLVSRAIQISTGILAARACCLLIVQTELMEKKILCFPPQQEMCVHVPLVDRVTSLSCLFCHPSVNRLRVKT